MPICYMCYFWFCIVHLIYVVNFLPLCRIHVCTVFLQTQSPRLRKITWNEPGLIHISNIESKVNVQ